MISEREFSKSHSTFWQELIPFVERFVRLINYGLVERYHDEVKPESVPDRRALISLVAQYSFDRLFDGKKEFFQDVSDSALKKIIRDASFLVRQYGAAGGRTLNADELHEIDELCKSIATYFLEIGLTTEIIRAPEFLGCGILDTCIGDYIYDSTLVEMKSVERNFRGVDIRQVLIYLSLANLHKNYRIKDICLMNPRRGVYVHMSVKKFVEELSGQPPEQIFWEVSEYVSSEVASL